MTNRVLENEPELLVLADRIHTCAANGTVRALLLCNGLVAATGTHDDLRAAAPGAPMLDLRGTTITPGLTDAHAHLTEWAFARREVDLADARSPTEAARRVADSAARRTQPWALTQPWVRGRGWNPHAWQDAPHRGILDALVPDRPIALQSHDMHALWVNSAALAAAGIDAGTADPDGGTIVRGADGEPTGLLLEWAGQLVTRHIDAPSLDDAVAAVTEAQAELHAMGITGIHSFPGIHLIDPDPLTVLTRMRELGALRLRILQHVPLDRLDVAIADGRLSGSGDEWIRMGGVKMFLDGALGSRTAWMREPYEDGSGCGMRTMDPAEFRAVVRRAAKHGIASTVHAIGDAAVCLALDVLSEPGIALRSVPHRIEHVQCCPAERLGDAAKAGITCSMQPSHLITDWSIADRHWGAQRSRVTYAVGSLHRLGSVLAFGSDVPVEPVDPRRGFHAAVRRQDLDGRPADGWWPMERMSAIDALHCYTVGPARAAGLPAPAGSLAPGAAADLVAWNDDPGADGTDFMAMRAVATMVAGELTQRE